VLPEKTGDTSLQRQSPCKYRQEHYNCTDYDKWLGQRCESASLPQSCTIRKLKISTPNRQVDADRTCNRDSNRENDRDDAADPTRMERRPGRGGAAAAENGPWTRSPSSAGISQTRHAPKQESSGSNEGNAKKSNNVSTASPPSVNEHGPVKRRDYRHHSDPR
jgi:hypothetical protein